MEARQPSRAAPSAEDRLAREEHAEAEIEALRDLNPEPLYQRFTGEALQAELAAIQQLQENGVHQAAELISRDPEPVACY